MKKRKERKTEQKLKKANTQTKKKKKKKKKRKKDLGEVFFPYRSKITSRRIKIKIKLKKCIIKSIKFFCFCHVWVAMFCNQKT